MNGTVDIALLLVALLAGVLIWRGPKMLPRIGEAFGKTVKEVRTNLPGGGDDVNEASGSGDTSEPSDRADS